MPKTACEKLDQRPRRIPSATPTSSSSPSRRNPVMPTSSKLASLAGLAIAGCSTVKPAFYELPQLPGGDDFSYTQAISGDGHVVVGESASANSHVHGEGARWIDSGGTWIVQG